MKQTNLIAAFVMLVAVSCTKKDQPVDTTADAEIQKLLDARDFQSEHVIYNAMTPEVKYKLWLNHFNNARQQFVQSTRTESVKLIDQFLGKMNVDVFKKDSKEQAVFLNYFIPQWTLAARKEFSALGFYDLVGDPKISTIRQSIESNATAGKNGTGSSSNARETAIPACYCHVGQLGYSCSMTHLTFDLSPGGGISLTIDEGRCQKSSLDCEPSSMGCGTLWLASCGGNSCQYS